MTRIGWCARASYGAFRNRYLSFVFRVALGLVFVISGAGKLTEGVKFVDQVEGANILPHALSRVYGTALPYVEIVVGALLILGLLSRFAAGIGGLAALSFIIGNSTRLYRGLYGECGCFGSIAFLQLSTRDALIVDVVLLIMAIQILVHKEEFLSSDSMIFRRNLPRRFLQHRNG
jgi:uncharacterized membrane protein YphA (DoxX/SURF4 family)